jgi:DNA-binding MarR family transcriptional regulator
MNNSDIEASDCRPERPDELLGELEETFLRLQRLMLPRHVLAGDGEITRPQYLLLHVLHHGGPARVSELAGVLDVGMPATSGMIDRLQRSEFVTRDRDETDRRAILVAITDAGRERLGEMEARVRSEFTKVLSVLTDDELETLIRLYDKLIDGATTSPDDN